MSTIKMLFQRKFAMVILVLVLAIGMVGVGLQTASAAGTLPCDAWSCVAAHSTVRALKASYSGRLYQVKRASNGNTTDISTLSAGGYANAAAQDTFCSGTTCTITIIYDQSGHGNDLTPSPAGGVCGALSPASATAQSIILAGNKVYAVKTTTGQGYRRNNTSGIPTGSGSAGTYAVFAGGNYNSGCCYDYGNAETNNLDDGDGTMGALYFGNATAWGRGAGSGPWVMADLENGLFAGGTTRNTTYSGNAGNNSTYVTAVLKNSSTNYEIRGGNAASGGLSTWYSGLLPNYSGYRPLKLQGAIILGTGGDNSCSAVGTFYEGAMASGMPSDSSDDAIQTNLASVYGNSNPGPTATPGTYYRITNRNSGKVIDVQSPNTTAGTKIGQYTANGQPWQDWQFVDLGTGYFNIVSRNSGMCMDVNGASTADGANIIQWGCGSGTNQQWQWVATGSYYNLKARHSGKCVNVVGSSTADSALLEQRACGTGNSFQWSR